MKAKITDHVYFDIENSKIYNLNKGKYIFSIYKINNSHSENELMDYVYAKIIGKDAKIIKINNNGFKGFLFSYTSKPQWADTIVDLLPFLPYDFDLFNSNVSFVLFQNVVSGSSESIYAVCGGIGHTLISKCIQKNFGLNLIPKLITTEDSFVKQVSENRLLGNHIYTSRKNRNATNLMSELGFSNVLTELELSVNNKVISRLGFYLSQDEFITLFTKHSIRISKSISINQLYSLINYIDGIDNEKMNFPLNPFILAEKKHFKNKEIKKLFKKLIKNNEDDYFNFEIVGDNVSTYSSYSTFIIESYDGSEILSSENPLEWRDLMDVLNKEGRITYKLLEDVFFKGHLILQNNENFKSIILFDCLNGYLTDNNNEKTFYLMNGNWYIIDNSFEGIIDEKFKEIFKKSKNYYCDEIRYRFPIFERKVLEYKKNNENKVPDESDFNKWFKDYDLIIYADTKPHKKIEIADIIVYDDIKEILYLFCLKDNFQSDGCRDLYGQIEASAHSIQYKLRNTTDYTLTRYYNELIINNGDHIVEEEIFKTFFNKKICYVAGFFKNLKESTGSQYGKILSYQIHNKLNHLGFDFILVDFSFDSYD